MNKSLFTILLAFILATTSFTLTSCGAGNKTEEVAAAVYTCPMHPEIKGQEGDMCNQCGMALEIVEGEEEHEHTDH